jgi:hypothetical protein
VGDGGHSSRLSLGPLHGDITTIMIGGWLSTLRGQRTFSVFLGEEVMGMLSMVKYMD